MHLAILFFLGSSDVRHVAGGGAASAAGALLAQSFDDPSEGSEAAVDLNGLLPRDALHLPATTTTQRHDADAA